MFENNKVLVTMGIVSTNLSISVKTNFPKLLIVQ